MTGAGFRIGQHSDRPPNPNLEIFSSFPGSSLEMLISEDLPHVSLSKLGKIFKPKTQPQLDIIHNAVKNALIKDGWTITDDPYIIQYQRTKLYADLGAERSIAAERGSDKIVVEVILSVRQNFKI